MGSPICSKLLDKLEFGGESPLTMRAVCYAFRYFPNPLGIVTAKQLDKLEFGKITYMSSLHLNLHRLLLLLDR